MERTNIKNQVKVNQKKIGDESIQALSELGNRMTWAAMLGLQYGGDRDIYSALGYPTDISYTDYLAKFHRHDIAKAVIKRPADATWRGNINIYDPEQPEETKKEDDLWVIWNKLMRELSLKSKFVRLDKLSNIGRFALLFLGFSDVKKREDFANPVQKGAGLKLKYVTPFGEDVITISEYDTDVMSERYGLPKIYTIQIKRETTTTTLNVHYSRVIHVTGEILDDEIYGIPTLEAVYNRLLDLEKVVGGSAEMYWRGARPGYSGKVDSDFTIDETFKTKFQEQLQEYENGLRRFLINEGVELKELAQQISDPKAATDVLLEMVSAVTGIPKRILTGSERGELSSTQDRDNWFDYITSRREEFCEEQILNPLIRVLMQYGILPERNNFVVVWKDLYITNLKDTATVGELRARALSAYSSNPAIQDIMPPEMFYRYFLGMQEDEIEELSNAVEGIQREMNGREQVILDEEEPENI